MNHPCINCLPDKCLRNLFSYLPLSDLLRLDLVCLRWKALQESMCKSIHQVTLLIGDDANLCMANSVFAPLTSHPTHGAPPSFKFRQIRFHWLDLETAQEIALYLHNISTVTFSIRGVTALLDDSHYQCVSLESVLFLLKRWSDNLNELQFYSHFSKKESKNSQMNTLLKSFFEIVNSMKMLTNFTFEVHGAARFSHQIDLPVICHLEQFFFCLSHSYRSVFQSLLKYGKLSDKLQQIAFSDEAQSSIEPNFYGLSINRELCSKFVLLPSHQNFRKVSKQMKIFCRRFLNLQSLTLTISNLSTFYRMVSLLGPLKQLFCLHLKLHSLNEDESEDELIANVDTRISLPSLESVRVLNVISRIQTHNALYAFQWEHLLPNLETVHLAEEFNDQFPECEICCKESSQWKCCTFDQSECHRLALQPFKRCTQLKRLYVTSKGNLTSWNVQQL